MSAAKLDLREFGSGLNASGKKKSPALLSKVSEFFGIEPTGVEAKFLGAAA